MKNRIAKNFLFSIALFTISNVASAEEKKNSVHSSLEGKLVELKGGNATAAKISAEVDYYVLYHSASWWGGCKAVTKQLVSLNEKNLKLGDKKKFQLILVDYDRTTEASIKYLKSSKINWPAIKHDKKESVKKVTSLGENGLPNVVLLKPDGSMVSNDRTEVLKRLEKLTSS